MCFVLFLLLISGKLVVTGVASDIHYSLLNVLCLTVVHTILCLLRGFYLSSLIGLLCMEVHSWIWWMVLIITWFFHVIYLVMFGENIFIVLLGLLLLRHGLPSHFLPEIQYLCTIFSYILCSNYIAPGSGE